jgi:pantoate--beta-alanine ligase
LSSRNGYLNPSERAEAVQLSKALKAMADALHKGENDLATIEARAMKTLSERGWKPDYLSVRRRHDLQIPQAPELAKESLVVLGAARLGTTRLIDNVEV